MSQGTRAEGLAGLRKVTTMRLVVRDMPGRGGLPRRDPWPGGITARPLPSRWPPALVPLAGLSWKRGLRGPAVLMLVQGRGRVEGRQGPEGLQEES